MDFKKRIKSYIDDELRILIKEQFEHNNDMMRWQYVQGKIDALSDLNLWLHENGFFTLECKNEMKGV